MNKNEKTAAINYRDDIKAENPEMSNAKLAINFDLARAELKKEIASAETSVAKAREKWLEVSTKLGVSYSGVAEYTEKCNIDLAEKRLVFLNELLAERFPS